MGLWPDEQHGAGVVRRRLERLEGDVGAAGEQRVVEARLQVADAGALRQGGPGLPGAQRRGDQHVVGQQIVLAQVRTCIGRGSEAAVRQGARVVGLREGSALVCRITIRRNRSVTGSTLAPRRLRCMPIGPSEPAAVMYPQSAQSGLGPLMVIGGAEDKLRKRTILKEFVGRRAARTPRIAVIPTASSLGPEVVEVYDALFRRLGAARGRRRPAREPRGGRRPRPGRPARRRRPASS